ncbi:MAG: MFS transporter [Novosphingobium sp.]|nr:MFS transporter [Novosphingobium sp.]
MRIYYGWVIVGASMLIFMLLVGCMSNAFGLFVLPISKDLGLSRADVNTGYILVILGGAAVAPFLGRLVDTYPVRRVMLACALLFSGGLVTVGLSQNVWLSAAMLVLPVAAGMGGVGTIGAMTIIARWFKAQRGRAMAISMMGMSLGTILLTPMVGLMIASLGWRNTLVALGFGMGMLFLIAIAMMREYPGPDDIEPGTQGGSAQQPQSDVPDEIGKPLSTLQILKMPMFLLPSIAAALALSAAQAIAISLVPMAQEAGIGVAKAATLMSMLGAASIAGKFLLIWVGDRVSRSISLGVMSLVTAISSGMLIFAQGYPMLMVSTALLGLAVGSITPALLALLADAVGAASFGSANGMAMLIGAFVGAAAMRGAGELYDRTGGYEVMFEVLVVVSLIALVLMLISLRIERRPAPVSSSNVPLTPPA